MISLPDFKEKQILFVKADWGVPSRLRFLNDNIVFEKDHRVVNRVSIHKTFAVFVCGDLSFTTSFLRKAREYGVSVFFIKNNFETYGGIMAAAEGHYVLRMKQYAMSDDEQLEISKKLVKNKILNQTILLKERIDSSENKTKTEDRCQKYLKKIDQAETNEELLGIEGNASSVYFGEYFKDISWRRRAPRTKEDLPNFLMDMGYTFLFNFVDSVLRLHGFDTFKGFYHRLFFQRRSLACDLMEPFRPLIDKQILKSFNLKQVKENDFKVENGAHKLPFENNAKYVQIFLECLMDNKEMIFNYVHNFYRSVMDPVKNEFPSC